MEFPRAVVVGKGVIKDLGMFLSRLKMPKRVLIISDELIKKMYGEKVENALSSEKIEYFWKIVKIADFATVKEVEKKIIELDVDLVIGMGGGTCIDIAKLSAQSYKKSFISVPTNAAHDGIASPFASIKDSGKPYSIVSSAPLGVLADIDIISSAPERYVKSGCGDLLAKLTAVKDWQLGRDEKGEYYGEYAANLALLSAQVILKNSEQIGKNVVKSVRDVVEALISAGVAAGIAGSSRPCSGSEHLFSHALDVIAPNKGLHGEKCGIGTIIISKLYNMNWQEIKEALTRIGAPTKLSSIGVTKEEAVEALLLAPNLRERYTILHKNRLSKSEAKDLLDITGVV